VKACGWSGAVLAIPAFVCSLPVAVILPFADINPIHGEANAKPVAAIAQVRGFRQALELYKADCGEYPTRDQGLAALVHDPGVAGWRGPYLQKDVPLDPWRHSYVYDSSTDPPAVISYGADGRRGGTGANADISSNDPHPERAYEKDRPRWMFLAVWLGSVFVLVGSTYVLVKA